MTPNDPITTLSAWASQPDAPYNSRHFSLEAAGPNLLALTLHATIDYAPIARHATTTPAALHATALALISDLDAIILQRRTQDRTDSPRVVRPLLPPNGSTQSSKLQILSGNQGERIDSPRLDDAPVPVAGDLRPASGTGQLYPDLLPRGTDHLRQPLIQHGAKRDPLRLRQGDGFSSKVFLNKNSCPVHPLPTTHRSPRSRPRREPSPWQEIKHPHVTLIGLRRARAEEWTLTCFDPTAPDDTQCQLHRRKQGAVVVGVEHRLNGRGKPIARRWWFGTPPPHVQVSLARLARDAGMIPDEMGCVETFRWYQPAR